MTALRMPILETLTRNAARKSELDADKALLTRAAKEIARLTSEHEDMLEALKLLVADVADYEPWQRPCYALDIARAAIAKATA